jgi:hypothetical protein
MADLGDILNGLIDFDHGDYSAELAQHILRMRFTDEQLLRYQDLADRNQLGTLQPEERAELEAFVTANSFLMILKSKARRAVVAHQSVA